MLKKVISGGQTGADRAGLDAALAVGFPVGGWMPKGFVALDGYHPNFSDLYSMQETDSSHYPPRTAMNVKESDGTVRIATRWDSAGEKLTLKMINQYNKPYIDFDPYQDPDVEALANWIVVNDVDVLNVAGNSERTSPGIYTVTFKFLETVFNRLKKEQGIVEASAKNTV